MRDFVEYIIKSLSGKPNQIKISEINTRRGTVYKVRVAREDLGKIIGKEGRTANSIRTLLEAPGKKFKRKYMLEISN